MAGTHFHGPVDSVLGFTTNGVATTSFGVAQTLADATGGSSSASLAAVTVTITAGTFTATTITDPTDTPATADALRDNLVATTIANIRTNITDLATRLAADKIDLAAISTKLTTVNNNLASIRAALLAAGVLV